MNEVEFVDINECPRPEFKIRDPQLKYLMDMLLGGHQDNVGRGDESKSMLVSPQSIELPRIEVTPPLLSSDKKFDLLPDNAEQAMAVTTDLEMEFLTSTPVWKKAARKRYFLDFFFLKK